MIKTRQGSKKKQLAELLSYFLGAERLKRAENIEDAEVSITKLSKNYIEASIKDYHIVIDISKRVILHDCPDWGRRIADKRLCKHVGKLMLMLKPDKALKIMNKIYSEKDSWDFWLYPKDTEEIGNLE